MYGSSLRLVTRMPREARMAASDAEAMPFPSEETTPPVTNTNLVMDDKFWKFAVYPNSPIVTNQCSISWNNAAASSIAQRAGRRNAGLRTQATRQPLHGPLAPDESEHRVDRWRLRRACDQCPH